MKNTITHNSRDLFLLIVLTISMGACDNFVKIAPPQTALIKSTVFTDDATATAAVIDMYRKLYFQGFASGDYTSISYLTALSSDEMIDYSGGDQSIPFNQNTLASSNTFVSGLWSDPYNCIYKANSIIEGLSDSSAVSSATRNQLMGEAKFIRAFCLFYLTNLFGDIPLVLSTDYVTNSGIGRSPQSDIYQQIIADLIDAQGLLLSDYSLSDNQRVRVNTGAATALLARVYLYTGDWANSEIQASNVILNPLYSLETDLHQVFYTTSMEAIWQFSDVAYPTDLFTFYLFSAPPNSAALRNDFLKAFEIGDQRKEIWIGMLPNGSDTLYFPTKYQSFDQVTEFSTVLRLSEQFLIRAEARANLDKLTDSQADLNTVRVRAGLDITAAVDKSTLLSAIENERKVELFTEWGHRWLDLKRTNRANAVLSPLKTGWVPTDVLYPIPDQQIQSDPAMNHSQNPGY